MKKLFLVVLAAGLFVACGNKKENTVNNDSIEKAKQDSIAAVQAQAQADSIAAAEAALAQAQADSIAAAELAAAEQNAPKTAAKGTKPTVQKDKSTAEKVVEASKAVAKDVKAVQTKKGGAGSR